MKKKNLLLFLGIIIVTVIVISAIFAPLVAPNDPYAVNLKLKLSAPSERFPLGTDQLGRCVLSRLIYGARQSMGAAFAALAATVLLGSIIGLLAGFFGGIVDRVVLWLCDIVLAFPGTLLALVIVGMFGASLQNLILAIAAVSWAGYARNIRSMVKKERAADYVRLAVTGGMSKTGILFRHILPNVMMPAVTLSVSSISGMIMRVAGMSFIGLGARLPTAEWGIMISTSREVLTTDPQLMIYSVGAVFITAFGLNLIGDGLRERFNPIGRTEG